MSISQAVILAGGLGTRLKPFTDHDPKPMIPIDGIPFMKYLLLQIRSWNITRVLILTGYLGDKISNFFGDGSALGLQIEYSRTPVEYDTGARIYNAINKICDDFILLYCDNYCPIPYKKAQEQFESSNCMIQIGVYANRDGYTKSNLKLMNGLITAYDKRREMPDLQGVDIGYAFVRRQVLERLTGENVNFESVIYPQLVKEEKLGGFLTQHRYYSIGSWERIKLTRDFFDGRKAVFLDRDGTLNERPPRACYVETPEQFIWLPGAIDAVKMLKDAGFYVFIISNQPGIARGKMTAEMLDKIHEKLHRDLREHGTDVDQIYYCPHGWDDGCDCRKPKPGLLFMAQRDWSLDLSKAVMIGDDERDIHAGEAADIPVNILVSETYTLKDAVRDMLDRNIRVLKNR